jgi:hypothetical protein
MLPMPSTKVGLFGLPHSLARLKTVFKSWGG